MLNKQFLNLFGERIFNQALLCKWILIRVNWFGSKTDMSFFFSGLDENLRGGLIILDGAAM